MAMRSSESFSSLVLSLLEVEEASFVLLPMEALITFNDAIGLVLNAVVDVQREAFRLISLSTAFFFLIFFI